VADSAEIRRRRIPRLISLSRHNVQLASPRQASGPFVHLWRMNDAACTPPGLEPVLTTSELAKHLGVPVQTIHDLRHAGRGPRGFRVGRELRYRLSEVQSWLAGLEEPGPVADGDPR